MVVLLARYSDDWQLGNEEIKLFSNTEKGIEKAINWIEFHIPWEEEHMKAYFKNSTNKISTNSRENIIHKIKTERYANNYNCCEHFPADFEFEITKLEVEE